MIIDKWLVLLILIPLWIEYCWKPAKRNWQNWRSRKHRQEYNEHMRKEHPELIERDKGWLVSDE